MPRIAVVTMTLARTEAEADLLAGALPALAHQGYPVAVADGGSPSAFIERLRGIPGLEVADYQPGTGPRLIGQVQAALAHAARWEPECYLYTEPDKKDFFERGMSGFVRFCPEDEKISEVGIVAAARDGGSFATFPAGQQLTERLTNELCASVLGRAGDYCYGPLLIRADLAPYLLGLRESLGWGWRPYLMAVAHRLGLAVACYPGDFSCPESQRAEDDAASRLYRMEQMAQNVQGLVLGQKVLLEAL